MTSEAVTAAQPADAHAADPARAPALGRCRLGTDLRRLREARSLRLADVAARLELAPSTLSRMESGQAPVRVAYLILMLDLYGVHDTVQRARLTNLARDGMCKSWHQGYRHLLSAETSHYLDLETAATHLRAYSVYAVPDLAQTAGYAAAAIRAARPGLTGPQVRGLVTLQVRRQEHARSAGRQLHMIIDESAFLRPVGTAQVMAGQLSHLLTLAADPAVTIQVAELAQQLPVLVTPFVILSFPGPDPPDVVCHVGIDGQIIITRSHADVHATHRAFTALAGKAASPGDTANIIKNAVLRWERQALTCSGGHLQPISPVTP